MERIMSFGYENQHDNPLNRKVTVTSITQSKWGEHQQSREYIVQDHHTGNGIDIKSGRGSSARSAVYFYSGAVGAGGNIPLKECELVALQDMKDRKKAELNTKKKKFTMEEKMQKPSLSIKTKLNRLFAEDRVAKEFDTLFSGTFSQGRFDGPKQFSDYLCEGALLNINTLASHSLSIPAGEYMVWVTDVGHTMLVPTKERKAYKDVLEDITDQYEVQTASLLKHWNKIGKALVEEEEPGNGNLRQGNEDGENESDEEKDDDGSGQKIQSRVNPADIDRNPMLRAMEDRGFTVTSLADAAGVQPPAISRLLRTPKDKQGDPGGRNPSMGLAAVISKLLRIDPTALFPDIFGASSQDLEARQTPGNRGSGMGNSASGSMRKGGKKWSQGESE
tara:strand:- start:2099 stop:3271 length:1173 start_codon:yes stop_codon:yes gene_type:complete